MIISGILLLVLGILKFVPTLYMTKEELQALQHEEGKGMHMAMLLIVADSIAEIIIGIELLVTP